MTVTHLAEKKMFGKDQDRWTRLARNLPNFVFHIIISFITEVFVSIIVKPHVNVKSLLKNPLLS